MERCLFTRHVHASLHWCIFMFVHMHKLGNESGVHILHMLMFLCRRLSNANPRLWHNHIISGLLFCCRVLATTTRLYGSLVQQFQLWNPYQYNRERVKYTEAQMWEAAWIKSMTEFCFEWTASFPESPYRSQSDSPSKSQRNFRKYFSCQVCSFQVDGVRLNVTRIHMTFSQSRGPEGYHSYLSGHFGKMTLEVKRHQPWRNGGKKQSRLSK